jgi:hypothetical protein
MNKNLTLFIENVFVWGGVITAYANALLPIIQALAGLSALIFSILSIIKFIKNWDAKKELGE